MANSKTPKANIKKSSFIYPAAFILPALVMVACGVIFKLEAIVPYIVLYAFLAAIPGFFLVSKKSGMAALVTSIIFIVSIMGYVTVDAMLYRSELINDKNLLGALSSALDKFPAFITQKDLDEVKVLILEGNYDPASGYPIEGFVLRLGYDESLKYLKAEDQSGYDGEMVESYFKTASSEIDINDYSALAKFSNLEYVAINQPNSYLYYYGITPNYLTKFSDLSIFENTKSLKDFFIFKTAATDFAPLSGLVSIENLSVQLCNVEDASVFGNLSNLKSLNLTAAGISDISFVSSLTGLAELYLFGNEISDIGAMKNLENLTDLLLNSNEIEDISPLAGLPLLANLYLAENQIEDISALSGLPLEKAYLNGNRIEDASPLFSVGSLTEMDISENALTNIEGIEKCASLETLSISGNQITDLSPLSSLEGLSNLYADGNEIEDLSPLESIIMLTNLSLKNNQISDISALSNLGNLSSVYLDENQITDFSPLASLEEREEMSTYVSGKDNQQIEHEDHDHDEDEQEIGDEPS